jgi:hypothetical protein
MSGVAMTASGRGAFFGAVVVVVIMIVVMIVFVDDLPGDVEDGGASE